ncbi:MAG: GvpL/GvpF family gas vesicle protein [Chlorobiaceae bacterium]
MNKQGIYIYGFVPNECIATADNLLTESGIYTIEFNKIAAVVSDTKIENIEYMNREELAHLLVDHQRKIEKIMSSWCSKIIPMQFGTIVSSGNDVVKIIQNGSSILNDTFKNIDAVEEIDLVVVWNDFGGIIKNISENAQIRKLKENIINKKSYDEADSISIGKLMKEKIDQKNNKVNNDIINSVMPFCISAKKHDTMNDEMPVNCAFLVKKEEHELFMEKIDALDQGYANKLNFKIVGPLPCYSFYTIESKLIKKDDIEKAKKILGIDLLNQDYDLKKAYRTKASMTHPDKLVDNANDENDSFIAANNAYKLLLEYASIITQSPENVSKDPLYLVKIKN